MTPSELLSLIQGDTVASTLAATGNDSGCAARCVEIADKVVTSESYSYRGLMDLLSIELFEKLTTVINNVADGGGQHSGLVGEARIFLRDGGLDFSNPKVAMVLQSFVQGGAITQDEYAELFDALKINQTITANDVSEAMRPIREQA